MYSIVDTLLHWLGRSLKEMPLQDKNFQVHLIASNNVYWDHDSERRNEMREKTRKKLMGRNGCF